jgi:hypothetical protein
MRYKTVKPIPENYSYYTIYDKLLNIEVVELYKDLPNVEIIIKEMCDKLNASDQRRNLN